MDTVTLDFASLTNECKQNVGAILRGMPQESGSFFQHWFYGLSVEDQSIVISWVLVPTMGTTKKVGTMPKAVRAVAPWFSSLRMLSRQRTTRMMRMRKLPPLRRRSRPQKDPEPSDDLGNQRSKMPLIHTYQLSWNGFALKRKTGAVTICFFQHRFFC